MLIAKTKNISSKFNLKDYLLILLTLFFLIYSFFSSNVPRGLNTEHYVMFFVILGAILLYCIDIRQSVNFNFFKENLLFFFFCLILIYGSIIGLSNNNSVKNILRDLVGISSFLSVIFIIHLKSDDKKVENIFKILIITGLIFSIKVFIFASFFLDHGNYPEDDPIQVS